MKTVTAYIKALSHELVAYITGGVVAASIAVYQGVTKESLPAGSYLVALGVAYLTASYSLWAKERRRADRAEEGPRLRLSFDASSQPCVYDFDSRSIGGSHAPLVHRLFRVILTNKGSQAATGVRVVIDSVEPLPGGLLLSYPLESMEGKPETAILHPGGKVWINLLEVAALKPHKLTFHNHMGRKVWVDAGDCEIRLRAEGGRAAVYGCYRLSLNDTTDSDDMDYSATSARLEALDGGPP